MARRSTSECQIPQASTQILTHGANHIQILTPGGNQIRKYEKMYSQKQSYLTPGGNQKSGFSVFSQSDSALKSGIIQLTEPIRFGFQLTEPIANARLRERSSQNPTHGANHIHIQLTEAITLKYFSLFCTLFILLVRTSFTQACI